MGTYLTGTGQELHNVHEYDLRCMNGCCIHNPSDHHMVDWPTHWSRSMMYRACPHGYYHPDPDSLKFLLEEKPGAFTPEQHRLISENDNHDCFDCDGCCQAP